MQHGKSLTVAALVATMLSAGQTNLLAQTNLPSAGNDKPVALAVPAPQKPVWLKELSLGIHEGYDNNVYMAGSGKNFHAPTSYPLPPGGVAAVENKGSAFSTISPKMDINFVPLLGEQDFMQTLSLIYAPDFVQYSEAPTENYNAQRLSAAVAGKIDPFSFKLDEGFTYIDGSKVAPTYPGAWYSSQGHAFLRERREQSQDRTTPTIQLDQEDWFVRATGSLLDYHLDTDQLASSTTTNTGYLDYVDRYDVNGGGDLGYRLKKDLAVTLGYRVGHQYQQILPFASDHYGQTASSDYQRLLAGIEGKLASWLDIKYQGGPDFRTYTASAPVRDTTPVKYYGEGSLTATPGKSDIIALNYRQWEWVSSTGKVPYYDSKFALTYKHQFTDKLSANLGGSLSMADYNNGLYYSTAHHTQATAAANFRNDWLYAFTTGLKYDITANLSVDLAYTLNLGRNGDTLEELATMSGSQLPATKRQFQDQIVMVGMTVKM